MADEQQQQQQEQQVVALQGESAVVPLPLVQDIARSPRLLKVDVRGDVLRPYTSNALQRAVLDLEPGRRVDFVRGRVSVAQIKSCRQSYVNAFLIQSRGILTTNVCDSCQNKIMRDPDAYAAPFPSCIRLPGHFGGACGNCKWTDHALRCSNRDGQGASIQRREDVQPVGLLPPAGGEDDPIQVEDDNESIVVLSDEERGSAAGSAASPFIID